jgi:hypothetical protein
MLLFTIFSVPVCDSFLVMPDKSFVFNIGVFSFVANLFGEVVE